MNYFSSSSWWLDKPNEGSIPYEKLSPWTELKYEIIFPPKIIKFPTRPGEHSSKRGTKWKLDHSVVSPLQAYPPMQLTKSNKLVISFWKHYVKFARRFVPGKFSQNDPLAQASRYLFGSFCEISQCFSQVISNGRGDNHDSITAQKMTNSARKSLIIDIYRNGMSSKRNPGE